MTAPPSIGRRIEAMIDDQRPTEPAEARDWYQAELARVSAISPEEWTARRDAEVATVREWAAAHRRNAA